MLLISTGVSTLANAWFKNNSVITEGSCISLGGKSRLVITNSTFDQCQSLGSVGAILISDSADLTMVSSTISNSIGPFVASIQILGTSTVPMKKRKRREEKKRKKRKEKEKEKKRKEKKRKENPF